MTAVLNSEWYRITFIKVGSQCLMVLVGLYFSICWGLLCTYIHTLVPSVPPVFGPKWDTIINWNDSIIYNMRMELEELTTNRSQGVPNKTMMSECTLHCHCLPDVSLKDCTVFGKCLQFRRSGMVVIGHHSVEHLASAGGVIGGEYS